MANGLSSAVGSFGGGFGRGLLAGTEMKHRRETQASNLSLQKRQISLQEKREDRISKSETAKIESDKLRADSISKWNTQLVQSSQTIALGNDYERLIKMKPGLDKDAAFNRLSKSLQAINGELREVSPGVIIPSLQLEEGKPPVPMTIQGVAQLMDNARNMQARSKVELAGFSTTPISIGGTGGKPVHERMFQLGEKGSGKIMSIHPVTKKVTIIDQSGEVDVAATSDVNTVLQKFSSDKTRHLAQKVASLTSAGAPGSVKTQIYINELNAMLGQSEEELTETLTALNDAKIESDKLRADSISKWNTQLVQSSQTIALGNDYERLIKMQPGPDKDAAFNRLSKSLQAINGELREVSPGVIIPSLQLEEGKPPVPMTIQGVAQLMDNARNMQARSKVELAGLSTTPISIGGTGGKPVHERMFQLGEKGSGKIMSIHPVTKEVTIIDQSGEVDVAATSDVNTALQKFSSDEKRRLAQKIAISASAGAPSGLKTKMILTDLDSMSDLSEEELTELAEALNDTTVKKHPISVAKRLVAIIDRALTVRNMDPEDAQSSRFLVKGKLNINTEAISGSTLTEEQVKDMVSDLHNRRISYIGLRRQWLGHSDQESGVAEPVVAPAPTPKGATKKSSKSPIEEAARRFSK